MFDYRVKERRGANRQSSFLADPFVGLHWGGLEDKDCQLQLKWVLV